MQQTKDILGNVWGKCSFCHFWRPMTEVILLQVFIQSPEGQQEKTVECCGSCRAWFEAKNFLFDEGVPK